MKTRFKFLYCDPQAKIMRRKLLSTRLYEDDQNIRLGETFRLKYKLVDIHSRFHEIFINISKDGTLSYEAQFKNKEQKSNKIDQGMVHAVLNNMVKLEKYILGDLEQQFSMGLN